MRRALLLLLPAAILAWALRAYNYKLLLVPKIGYILYGLTGGQIPPYFDNNIFLPQHQAKWKSDRDVFAAVPGKSGTTWLLAVLHEIRTKGNPPPFKDIQSELKFAELVYYPGQSMDERIEILSRQKLEARFPAYNLFKTHLSPQDIGYRADAKYVITVRNLVDAAASFYPFLRQHDAGFAKMWGGFPPTAGAEEREGDMLAFREAFLHDMGNGKTLIDVAMLNLIAGFWPLRHASNVHFMHYRDLVSRPREEVAKLSKFLNVTLSDEELDLVVHHTSFAEMKRESCKYDANHIFDEFKLVGKVPAYVNKFLTDVVNKGPSRNGVEELSEDFVRDIRAYGLRVLGKEAADWVENGGPMP